MEPGVNNLRRPSLSEADPVFITEPFKMFFSLKNSDFQLGNFLSLPPTTKHSRAERLLFILKCVEEENYPEQGQALRPQKMESY